MKGIHSADLDCPGTSKMIYEEMKEDVVNLRPEVDFLVVSIHTGFEFMDYPHPDYREMALNLVRDGTDLIIGHHPHVIQGFEKAGDE